MSPLADEPRRVTAASLARERERREYERALLAIKYDLAADDLIAIQAEGFRSHLEAIRLLRDEAERWRPVRRRLGLGPL